ncbi:MAG TPA: flavin monoamine oxidase family protein [Stellaceae bacterium]|nr:flavin monoamine oxidase family protein [Stellaceae bacterium]
MTKSISRRGFLNLVGRAGGAAAVYQTMAAMGLLPVPEAYAGPPALAPHSGRGVHVAILGAGIAGMTAAFELSRAGYRCTILEARRRAGGRNWTLRRGDLVEEIDSRQHCDFSRGPEIYLNVGPARIPQHHQAILGYCRQFGVVLEPLVNENRNAFFQSDRAFNGKPIRQRRFINDSRGYIAELLAKAINQHALDDALTGEDRGKFLAMLRNFGALERGSGQYKGSSRLGYSEWPGAGDQPGTEIEPLPLAELLKPSFAYFQLNWSEFIDFAPTMLQPTGGMDRIARAFEARVHPMIRYGAEVTAIKRAGDGVRILYGEAQHGAPRALRADYCLCTIPLTVLREIESDFSAEFKQAIATPGYENAIKIGFEAKRRFWEEDEQIYGGISWTEDDITQIWYPSTGFQGKSGVLLGAYVWSDEAEKRMGALSPDARVTAALASGAKLHPNYRRDLAHGISVAWGKIPFSRGSWAEWTKETRAAAYATLNRGEPPIYLAGEHLSYVTGWQEGAVLSAHAAVKAIDARVRARKA